MLKIWHAFQLFYSPRKAWMRVEKDDWGIWQLCLFYLLYWLIPILTWIPRIEKGVRLSDYSSILILITPLVCTTIGDLLFGLFLNLISRENLNKKNLGLKLSFFSNISVLPVQVLNLIKRLPVVSYLSLIYRIFLIVLGIQAMCTVEKKEAISITIRSLISFIIIYVFIIYISSFIVSELLKLTT